MNCFRSARQLCMIQLVWLAFLIPLTAIEARTAESNGSTVQDPTLRILDRASAFFNSGKGDSAMVYYNRAAKLSERQKDTRGKQLEVKALLGKWSVYFFYFFDYSKAFEALAQARLISEQQAFSTAPVDFREGLLYHALSDQCNDEAAARLALNNYQRAFAESGSDTEPQSLNNMMVNYILIAHKLGNTKSCWGRRNLVITNSTSFFWRG